MQWRVANLQSHRAVPRRDAVYNHIDNVNHSKTSRTLEKAPSIRDRQIFAIGYFRVATLLAVHSPPRSFNYYHLRGASKLRGSSIALNTREFRNVIYSSSMSAEMSAEISASGSFNYKFHEPALSRNNVL